MEGGHSKPVGLPSSKPVVPVLLTPTHAHGFRHIWPPLLLGQAPGHLPRVGGQHQGEPQRHIAAGEAWGPAWLEIHSRRQEPAGAQTVRRGPSESLREGGLTQGEGSGQEVGGSQRWDSPQVRRSRSVLGREGSGCWLTHTSGPFSSSPEGNH